VRELDEIIRNAVAVINPPTASKEACYARVDYCISDLIFAQGLLPKGTPATERDTVREYLQALHKTRKLMLALVPTLCAIRGIGGGVDRLGVLDGWIREAEIWHSRIIVRHGSRQWDSVAEWSALVGHHLLVHDECSWRQKATLTDGGPWLRLSSLLYEAATGKYDRDLAKYCRQCNRNPVCFWQEVGKWNGRRPYSLG
jgi:hypothetical protein